MKDVSVFGRIGVLMGGVSSEREISLKSGRAVVDVLTKAGCSVEPIDIQDDNKETIKNLIIAAEISIAFITLHGRLGEDGQIQQICEELGVVYTGSPVDAHQRAFNKATTAKLLKNQGIVVPNFVELCSLSDLDLEEIYHTVGRYPLIVKPACEGSSIGVYKVFNEHELIEAVTKDFAFGQQVLVESFIDGKELTVGVLDEEAYPVIEIITDESFFDYQAKYSAQSRTVYVVPADLRLSLTAHVQDVAIQVFRMMECQGAARVDFRLDSNGNLFVLEINTIPGMTSSSLLPKAALASGINYQNLCLKIIESAYAKKTEKSV